MNKTMTTLFLLGTLAACSGHQSATVRTIPVEEQTTLSTSQLQALQSNQNDEILVLVQKDIPMNERIESARRYYKQLRLTLNAKNGLAESLTHFTTTLSDLHKEMNTARMSPTRTESGYPEEAAFYALAATTPKVIINLIEGALLKDYQQVPAEEKEEILVQGNLKVVMIEFITARMDIMAALALDGLTTDDGYNMGHRATNFLFRTTRGLIGAVKLPESYPTLTADQRAVIATQLATSERARAFLRKIEEPTDLDRTVKSGLRHIDFGEKKKNNNKELNSVDPQKNEIRSSINALLG
jgi:hypothetical protein